MIDKIIYDILNCKIDKLENECRKLDATGYYWKLVSFDSGVHNLNFTDFNEVFGKYQVWGVGDYKQAFVIDRMVLNNKQMIIPFSVCINFDSNVSSYISSMIFKGRKDSDLIDMLKYFKRKKYQTTCQHYCLELTYNDAPINEKAIFNTLYADSLLEQMREEDLNDTSFELVVLREEEYIRIKKVIDGIKADKGTDWECFYILYAMIMKAFLIKSGSNKSTKHKVKELLDFIISDIGVYYENEAYLCAKYIDKDEDVAEFFRHIQKGREAEKNLKDIKSMAWDLLHLRNVIDEMRIRNTQSNICFLHCFASYEKGLIDLIKINPIKKMLYVEDGLFCKYEHEVFDIEECGELKTVFEERFKQRVKNENMKELCIALETEIRSL